MVQLALPALAALALAPIIGAAPSPAPAFSFASWVEDLIANPDDHLSAEDAIAVYKSSINARELHDKSSLQKRANCATGSGPAPVEDAVRCIQELVGKASNACEIDGRQLFSWKGNAQIYGVIGGLGDGTSSYHSVPCNDIARAAGWIMDGCTNGNLVKGSELCPSDHYINVIIQRND